MGEKEVMMMEHLAHSECFQSIFSFISPESGRWVFSFWITCELGEVVSFPKVTRLKWHALVSLISKPTLFPFSRLSGEPGSCGWLWLSSMCREPIPLCDQSRASLALPPQLQCLKCSLIKGSIGIPKLL